ncbi:metallophosphoesterase [Massilia sp. erpn]|uniref:metallophosphoesterase family protein n=1 Tax=Massilia sp. erpn TaxID=2738142 RepID=UPI00220DB54E|nr:alkaline phosphatase [Massilia sp. erpn]
MPLLQSLLRCMPCALGLLATLPPAAAQTPAPIIVYTAGDIADCRYSRPQYSGAARTAAVVEAGIARDAAAGLRSAVLSLGDHTYPIGLEAEFRDCYAPTWGRFKDITHPTPGNHEYYGGSADGYYGYFGAAAGPRGRGYYSFDLGGWHLVSLNSHMHGEEQRAQMLWLKDDLERHPRRCTLAYWHAPMYSSGGHSASLHMQEAWRLLQAAGAELVLSGHDHDYERFAPLDADGRPDAQQGMRQFVIGTGGAFLTPFRWPHAHSEVRANRQWGVLKLALKEDGYDWEFLPADKGVHDPAAQPPDEPDSGSARCR